MVSIEEAANPPSFVISKAAIYIWLLIYGFHTPFKLHLTKALKHT